MARNVIGRMDTLIGADRDRGGGRHGRHAGEVVRRNRLLEEVQSRIGDGVHEGDCLLGRKSLVGVGRDQAIRAEDLADRTRPRRVFLGPIHTDLDLEGGEAVGFFCRRVGDVAVKIATADDAEQRQPGAVLVAEQRVHRPASRAAGEIMQRDLDCGFAAVVGVHACVHGGTCAGDVAGLAADQHRRQVIYGRHHAGEGLAGHGGCGCGFTPAHEPVVRFDAHQHVVGAGDGFAGHDQRLEHGQADGDRLDTADAHA